jgi:hypothetical protein
MQSALRAERVSASVSLWDLRAASRREAIAHHQLFSSPAQFDPKVEIIHLSARGLTLHGQRKHK